VPLPEARLNRRQRAARSLQNAHGGSYQHHLRHVGGGAGRKLNMESRIRKVLLNRALWRERPVAVIDANLLRNRVVIAERQARYRSYGEQIVLADATWNEIVANETCSPHG
jgi:hypothetical protein